MIDEKSILRIQIDALDQEMTGIYRAKILHEVKLSDAATSTGDARVDKEFGEAAENSTRTMLAQNRMLEVRKAKTEELHARLDQLMKAG